jgi:1-aminocyclopropane-1-carboxylate deaminase/D-cysteine desulfhydrase-like pyridoxal-dependent ACC family enzyme
MNEPRALEALESWPRTPLASLPTPLVRAARLGRHLDVPHVYVKMDADTGFALGGNKVRKLEFELADRRLESVTCLVTAGGAQSNHCRVTAAFAARRGLRCVLVVQGPVPEPPTGNALIHRLFGAEFEIVAERAERAPAMVTVAERLEAEGEHPLVIPIGASTGLGCLGYARAARELVEQLDALDDGCEQTLLFSATSSGGTLAGLLLGLSLLGRRDVALFGVSADAPADELRETTVGIAEDGATLLQTDVELTPVPLINLDDQVGDGYGLPTAASREATALFGRLEGIVLDPTYTSKAAAGLLEYVRRHSLAARSRVVFLHTGGAPGLLA